MTVFHTVTLLQIAANSLLVNSLGLMVSWCWSLLEAYLCDSVFHTVTLLQITANSSLVNSLGLMVSWCWTY